MREGREGYRHYDKLAIEKILLDGYMFCGKEEHNHCGKHIDHFEMGYQDGEKIWNGNSAFYYAPVKFDSVSYKVALA